LSGPAPPLTLREAAAADAGAAAELLAELGYPVSAGQVRARLGRGGERVLLAESAGRALGLLALAIQPQLVHARPVARVTALVVGAGTRRRGVGRRLMERAAELARAGGCEGVELTTAIRPEREEAHRLYALGYERTSYRFWLPFPAEGRP
jgi:ribosomal protein S18 acetylase RimI-like enzyme